MLMYEIENTDIFLTISDSVLKHFNRHKQVNVRDKEAGGQLFANICDNEAIIVQATGPRFSDRRTRTSYVPNRVVEQREITKMFKKGLHYIGDWHTHPTAMPVPSTTDRSSIQSCFKTSSHELNAFVLIIVGTADFPRGLSVTLQSKNNQIEVLRYKETLQSCI